MSLNRSLDRLFDEIRREAKRNPDFANRLDAVMLAHGSRRDVPDEVIEGVCEPLSGGRGVREANVKGGKGPTPLGQDAALPQSSLAGGGANIALNPVAIYRGDGEAALLTALSSQDLTTLQALVTEHNLDPSGDTGAMDLDALVAHIIAQAKRRAERDEKLFDY